jgi:hypothetical protein
VGRREVGASQYTGGVAHDATVTAGEVTLSFGVIGGISGIMAALSPVGSQHVGGRRRKRVTEKAAWLVPRALFDAFPAGFTWDGAVWNPGRRPIGARDRVLRVLPPLLFHDQRSAAAIREGRDERSPGDLHRHGRLHGATGRDRRRRRRHLPRQPGAPLPRVPRRQLSGTLEVTVDPQYPGLSRPPLPDWARWPFC